MKKHSIIASVLLLALAACSTDSDSVAPAQQEVVLTANVEAAAAWRTNFTSEGQFFWTQDDKIAVYGTGGSFGTFKAISGAGSCCATFSGVVNGSFSTCAVYPAAAAKGVTGTSLTFEAPSSYQYEYEQTDFAEAMTPTVNSANIPMLAKITDSSANLAFKNLGGAFCFQFKDVPANTTKVVFTAKSKICGSFSVDLSAVVPVICTEPTTDKDCKSVAVEFEPSAFLTDRVVYIPVPCGTYEGFEVEMYDSGGVTTAYIESSKTKVVKRSSALRFSNVTITTLSDDIEGEGDTPSDPYNGHEYVDLGLPSGLLWATCNVGASKPEEYGDYFAWGETATKSDYSTGTSTTYNKTTTELKSAGVIDSNGNLTADYDAATKNWGAPWRMPTLAEFAELVDKCTTEWTTQGGVNGRKVTGPNGNSIFVPAAGYYYGTSLYNAGSNGYYWSSTAYDGSKGAYYLYFSSSYFYTSYNNRYDGQSIRPVSEP